MWSLQDGTLRKTINAHERTAWCLNFKPGGKTIASSSEDGTIKLWNVEEGNLEQTLKGHKLTVWVIQFSPDGSKLASGSYDHEIKLWDSKDGSLIRALTGHTEAVVDLAFSPDGKILASTSDDKTIGLWNAADGKLIRSLATPEHQQAATFSPDGKRLVTSGRDKPALGELLQNLLGDSKFNKGVSMRLWDVATGALLQTFSQHENDVNDVAFSPDGKTIVAASSDKTVSIWRVMH
jgi:WD40 repeat protein